MPKLIAVIGFLVMSAGLDLLWQSRWDIRYWLDELVAAADVQLDQTVRMGRCRDRGPGDWDGGFGQRAEDSELRRKVGRVDA